MSKNIEGVGEVATPSTLKEKLQNFIYHYKWHTVAALIVVAIAVICSVQLCSKSDYDAHILYIGGKTIGRTAEDGDVAEIVTVNSSLKQVVGDYDKNGQVTVDFTSYYYLSQDEINKLDNVNDSLLATDRQSISSVLEHSEFYLCFISVSAYENYHNAADEERFVSLTEYASDNPNIRYYSSSAIYLSSTALYELPGISNLPDDTLICIRRPSVLAGKSKEHTAHIENAKTILKNILKFE